VILGGKTYLEGHKLYERLFQIPCPHKMFGFKIL